MAGLSDAEVSYRFDCPTQPLPTGITVDLIAIMPAAGGQLPEQTMALFRDS